MEYQEIFNDTLKRMKMVMEVTGNERLMRSLVKIMFDFSDNMKRNNLLKEEEPSNAIQGKYKNNHR